MRQEDYVVWDEAATPGVCTLTKLTGLEKTYRLTDGVSLIAEAKNCAMHMDPDTPDETDTLDVLINPYGLIVASQRLTEFLMERSIPKVEYLPVSILDPKKKPIQEKYFIVHPIDHVECLNADASEGEWDIVDDSVLESVRRVVLNLDAVDRSRSIFRPKPLLDVVLVRRELATAIDAAGFQGSRWIELADYSTYGPAD